MPSVSMVEQPAAGLLALNYLGDVVFAASGALAAGRQRMDVVGFVLIGTITGIGGGTLRDVLLGLPAWWTKDPRELLLCVGVGVLTYVGVPSGVAHQRWLVWCDALGLAAFAVVGAHAALVASSSVPVAIFLGVVTATGGGVVRDTLCGSRPLIASGQLYATAALGSAACYTALAAYGVSGPVAQAAAFATGFVLRAIAILCDVRLGPPGEALRVGRRGAKRRQPP